MANVVKITVYGNGKVFLGTRHVLVVLKCNDGKYHLLEVGIAGDNTEAQGEEIVINHTINDSLAEAVNSRNSKKEAMWWDMLACNTPMSIVDGVISEWNESHYDMYLHNCQDFARDVLQACGVTSNSLSLP